MIIEFFGMLWREIYIVAFVVGSFFALAIIYAIVSVLLDTFHIKLPKFSPIHIYRDETGIHLFKWAKMTDIPEWLDVAAKERMTDLETTSHILVGQDCAYMISVAQDRKSYKVYQRV
jgi:hypothetical protein